MHQKEEDEAEERSWKQRKSVGRRKMGKAGMDSCATSDGPKAGPQVRIQLLLGGAVRCNRCRIII